MLHDTFLADQVPESDGYVVDIWSWKQNELIPILQTQEVGALYKLYDSVEGWYSPSCCIAVVEDIQGHSCLQVNKPPSEDHNTFIILRIYPDGTVMEFLWDGKNCYIDGNEVQKEE